MIERLFEPDRRVALGAARALGAQVLDDEGRRALETVLEGTGWGLRRVALDALGRSGLPAAAPALQALAGRDLDAETRGAVLEALYRLWPGRGSPPAGADFTATGDLGDPPDPEELAARLRSGDVPALENRLARLARAAAGPAVPALQEALGKGARPVAVVACRIARLAAPGWRGYTLEDMFYAARWPDRPALAAVASPRGLRRIRATLRRELAGDDLGKARQAAWALGLCGEAEDHTRLEALLEGAPAPLRLVSIDAARRLRRRTLVRTPAPALLAALGDPDPEVRAAAARAVAELPEQTHRLEGVRHDPDPDVRRTSLRLLFAHPVHGRVPA